MFKKGIIGGTAVKRHLFKFLLSLVRTLVFAKRFMLWLFRMIGRFFVLSARPLMPYVVVPLYALGRRLARQYREISENPSERRRRVLTSQPVLVGLFFLITFSVARTALAASTRPGVIPGAHSFFISKILSGSEADWVSEDISGIVQANETQTVVYSNGATYVFPYSGLSGHAQPQSQEQKTEPDKKPVQKYAVQRGDTLARIAKKFGIKTETILWANNISEKTTLRQGDVLTVPAVDGVLYTVKSGGTVSDVARLFKMSTQAVATANNLSAGATLNKGQVLIVPGVRQANPKTPTKIAQAPNSAPVPEPETPAPAESAPAQEEPTPPAVEPPTKVEVAPRPQLAPGAKLLWPTQQHSITQYFSARHPGIDFNGDYTDRVYAADDGTVVQSGWNNSGYGNMILIDHGNGMRTRYGHNSKVFVSVGQEVKRGDVIAMVGTTGRSTGTHLHFEVVVNGQHVNPLKYVK